MHRFAESKLVFPLIVLVAILLFDLVFDPGFFGLQIIDGHLYGNLIDILRNGSTVMLLAIGMTLVIATGGVDLSVGAVMAIRASIAALLIDPDFKALTHDPNVSATPLWLVFVVTLTVATLCGLWNGILVAYGGIQPMVATLILMIAGRGIAQLITESVRIQIFYEPYAFLGNGWVVLPFSLFIVAVGLHGLLAPDPPNLARHVHRGGRDQRPIELLQRRRREAGQARSRTCPAGSAPGMAGLVASSNIRTSDANNIGLNLELDAILAVVIGGTALGAGGRFSLFAAIIGALVIQAITTSMYAIGVPANALLTIKGIVVIIVILLLSDQVRGFIRRAASRQARPT